MTFFDPMLLAFESFMHVDNLLFILAGSLIGLVLGMIPGLTGVNGMLILLPFTFGMNPGSAMLLFAGMMGGQVFGGSVTAILLKVPGTPMNAATVFDGYPMAMRGEAGRALSIAAISSLAASTFGLLILGLLIPFMKEIILLLGPPEFFVLVICGIIAVAMASQGNFLKGLAGAGIGALVSLVGFSNTLGGTRFMFGSKEYLFDGVEITSLLIGFFAISQMIEYVAQNRKSVAQHELIHANLKGVATGAKDVWTYKRTWLQGSIIGYIIGLVPGVGGVLANFLAYITAMKSSKSPDQFGKGTPEGIVASESSNSSKDGGALFPTIAFGIPGSAEMVVLLGAFVFHGLQPGPLFMRENPEIVWILILGFLASNVIACGLGLVCSPFLARVTRVNLGYLIPFIIASSLIGVYTERGIIWDVLLTVFFGILGYLFKLYGYPIVTIVLGFVLGPMTEKFFFQSLSIAYGSPIIFVQRPISLILTLLMIGVLIYPFIAKLRKKKTEREEEIYV